ncbi:MAG TPA: hypothetical protein VKR30_00015 [Candidatus Limnocylindrales bacterium]|nr:hypothetical protein [Candidatus Limnocylindrales bacterium]
MTADRTIDQPAAQAVRAGQLAPVTCLACGCRLETIGEGESVSWFHFGRMAGRDARGCRVSCIDAAHDVEGHAALAA